MDDLYGLQGRDQAITNARRLQRLWEEEVDRCKKSEKKPSLLKCVFRFISTRLWISTILFMIAIILQFIAPVNHQP